MISSSTPIELKLALSSAVSSTAAREFICRSFSSLSWQETNHFSPLNFSKTQKRPENVRMVRKSPFASSPSSSSLLSLPSMYSWPQHTQGGRRKQRRSTWPEIFVKSQILHLKYMSIPGRCRWPSRTRFEAVTNALQCWLLSSSAQLWCLSRVSSYQVVIIFLSSMMLLLSSSLWLQFAKWLWSGWQRKSVFVERRVRRE